MRLRRIFRHLYAASIVDCEAEKIDSSKIELRRCPLGLGLFAREDIRAGEFLAGFYGQIYTASAASRLPVAVANHAIQFGTFVWRDSHDSARYFNHSCVPNCYVRGDFDVVALRHIAAGEELTWDYSMTENSDWEVPGAKCLCGASACRGSIPPYRMLPASEKHELWHRTSRWIRQTVGLPK
jgi:uncharacterized protein